MNSKVDILETLIFQFYDPSLGLYIVLKQQKPTQANPAATKQQTPCVKTTETNTSKGTSS